MIELLNIVARAECENCHKEIVLHQSDLRTKPFWSHPPTDARPGQEACLDAPVATPKEGTVINDRSL